MRQIFLLDENILYHAVRGVDRHDRPDTAARELLEAIARICHGISLHLRILDRYVTALKRLREHPPRSLVAQDFITQLLHNNAKRSLSYAELPPLPADVQVPREDEEIVRTAMICGATLVTADAELLEAINRQPELQVRAVDTRQALELARSERP